MSATKRSLESNSTKKYAVNNIKNRNNNNNRSVSTESKTSTDNLTTLTSTSSASDHPHKTTHNDEEIFVKPTTTTTTTHKKFIKRNPTELKLVRRQPKYDRSKFKYLAPSHRLSDSSTLNINNKKNEECKDQHQQEIVSKEDFIE